MCLGIWSPRKRIFRKESKFWQYLEEDAKRADTEGKGFILQGDLNSWLGKNIIPNDPRQQNENGRLMEDFVSRNNLTVVNGLSLCKGLITRTRQSKNTCEKSILDFFVVCGRVLPHVISMEIDESKQNILTNYTEVRKGCKAVDSDHVPMEINLDFKIFPTQQTRVVMYNFKNERGKEIFKRSTTDTSDFTNIFESKSSLQDQCQNWKNMLETHCKKSFPKIRIRSQKIRQSKADIMIKERNIIKKKHDDNKTTPEEDSRMYTLEKYIANTLAEEGFNKAKQF